MKSKISVKQNGFRDCAAACLLSLIRYNGGNMSKDEISYLIKTDKHGTNAFNLIEGAKMLGFDGYGMKVTFKELIKGNTSLPVIAHTRNQNMYHYVVIYEINKKYLKIMDPSIGIKKIKLKDFEKIYLNTLLFIYPIKPMPEIQIKDKIIKSIINSLITNKKYIIRVVLISLFVTLLNIIINLYLKVYIDYVYPNLNKTLLINVTLCFLMVIFLKCLFENIRNKILIDIKSEVNSNITNNSINHIMHLPYHHFKNKPSGEIISRLDDLDNFKELVSTILLNIFVNIFLMVISMIVLLTINKSLFLLSLIIIIFYSIVVFIYSNIFKNKINSLQTINGEYKKELCELINSYETLKNLNLVDSFLFKIKTKFNALVYRVKSFEYSYSNEKSIKDFISEFGIIFIASIGLVLVSKKIITMGDLVAYTSLLLFFIEPIKELLNLTPNIKFAINSYERINDILNIKKENINNMNKKMLNGDIKVSNLSYSYNNMTNTFENLNVNIKEKSKLLIYGSSGSGKSTFIKILLKYFEGYKGDITYGYYNLKDIEKEVLYNSITYVSQKEILMNETIKNNIIMGREIANKDYNEIIKICNVDKIIEEKSLRDNFLIEENGYNLSGGERQKVILARGLLKKSNYIILDEALSEVGFDEEIKIIKRILKKYEKKTIIYVSHKKEIINFFNNKCFFSKKGDKNVNE